MFVAFLFLISTELGNLGGNLDDLVIILFSGAALLFLYVSRKKTSLKELRIQNDVIMTIFTIVLLTLLAGIFVIQDNPNSLPEGIPALILMVLAIINRFI